MLLLALNLVINLISVVEHSKKSMLIELVERTGNTWDARNKVQLCFDTLWKWPEVNYEVHNMKNEVVLIVRRNKEMHKYWRRTDMNLEVVVEIKLRLEKSKSFIEL